MNPTWKKIEELAEKGLIIDYVIVDQKENGTYDMTGVKKTYTVNVSEVSSFHGSIESESFDSLEEGIKKMIKFAEKRLKQ